MKKFRWVSALTSMVMAAALMVTGCSSDGGGSSAPADSRLSLSRYIAETAPDADGYIDLNAADIDSKVIFGDAEISKSVKIKNLKCGSGAARTLASEEQKALTNVITFKVKSNNVEFKNVDGVKIVMESGTLRLEESKALALSVTGASGVSTVSTSGKDVEIPTVDIKAESGADIAVSAGELNVSKEVQNLTISGGEVKKLSIAQKSDTEQASLNVTGSETKINDIEVKSPAGTPVANKAIDISFGNGASAETLYANAKDEVKAALTAATKEWEITDLKFVRPEKELKQSIFKGNDIDLTGFSLIITKTVKGGTDTKNETVPMTQSNTQTENVTYDSDGGKFYKSLNLKYKGSDKILKDESDSSEVKLELTGIEKLYPQPFVSTTAFEDTDLVLTFDSAPVVNRTIDAKVAVKSGSTTVDEIGAKDETLQSFVNKKAATINVKDNMITVDGNKVIIKIHAADDVISGTKLGLNTEYSVELPKGLISGTIDGVTIDELKDVWSFKTRESAPLISDKTIQVGGENAQFASVQGAFNYIMRTASTSDASSWKVNVAEGTYYERLSFFNQKASVTLTGANTGDATGSDASEKTVIRWANLELWNRNNGGGRERTIFLWEGADLNLKKLTVKNIVERSVVGKDKTQAEALYFDSQNNLTAFNCFFRSHQDTILVGNNGGKCWFYKCYIEGDTDYIWGYADVCLVEECVLHCIRDTFVNNQKSYLLECRTVATNNTVPKGFVIFNSKVNVDSGVTAYYGRDASSGACTQGAVVNTEFTGTVHADLWGHCGNKSIHAFDQGGVCAIGYKAYNNKINGAVNNSASTLADTYALTDLINGREFNGRRAIFNRVFNKTTKAYEAAADSKKWDLTDFEKEFEATPDASINNLFVEPLYTVELPNGATTPHDFTVKDIDGNEVTLSECSNDMEGYAAFDGTKLTSSRTGTARETKLFTLTKGTTSGKFSVEFIAQEIPATAVEISGISGALELDDKVTLSAVFTPSNTTNKTVTWTSGNSDIVSIDPETGVATAKCAGSTTITVTSKKYDGISKTIDVTVNAVGRIVYFDDSAVKGKIYGGVGVSATDGVMHFANGDSVTATPSNEKFIYDHTNGVNLKVNAGELAAWYEFSVTAPSEKAITLKAISGTWGQTNTGNIGTRVDVNGAAKASKTDRSSVYTKESLGNVVVDAGQTVTVKLGLEVLSGKNNQPGKAWKPTFEKVTLYYTADGLNPDDQAGVNTGDGSSGPVKATWNFEGKGTQGDLTFGGIFTDGKFPADDIGYADDATKKIELLVSGTFKSNGNCAQHGTETTIKVPVVTVGDKVSVTGFSGCTDYVLGGTEYTDAAEQSYEATSADVAAGYVTITGKSNMYIVKITCEYTTLPNKPAEKITALWDWQNGSPESIKTTNILPDNEGSVPSNVDGISLKVIANTGKLQSRWDGNNDAQFNSGAVIKVPVTENAEITVTSYPGYHNYKVAGTPADADTKTYIATAEDAATGYIEIVATAESYLYSIKAVYVTTPAGSGTATTGTWTLMNKTIPELGTNDASGIYTLTNDISLSADSESPLTLLISKAGTGVGVSKSNAPSITGQSKSTAPLGSVGLGIKNAALKIANIKGNVKLTIAWYINSSNKVANDRRLEVTVGDTGTPVETPNTATDTTTDSKTMADYVVSFDAGSGTNVYIGASNSIFIKSIKIEAVSN